MIDVHHADQMGQYCSDVCSMATNEPDTNALHWSGNARPLDLLVLAIEYDQRNSNGYSARQNTETGIISAS